MFVVFLLRKLCATYGVQVAAHARAIGVVTCRGFYHNFLAKFLCCAWPTVRIEKGTGAEMRPAMVCGIVTGRVGKLLDSLSITYTANGKRQIQVENFSK